MSKRPEPDIEYWKKQAIVRQAIILRQRETIERRDGRILELARMLSKATQA